jgi:hypothetical protein
LILLRAGGVLAGIAAFHRAHSVAGALDRRFGNVGSMRIADRFALHCTQAKALRGIVGRLLEPAIVESQGFSLPVFEEEFAVIGAIESARNDLCQALAVQTRTIHKRNRSVGHYRSLCVSRRVPCRASPYT